MQCVQRKVRAIFVQIDGSGVGGATLTTNGINIGAQHVKVTETGNGAYTITLNDPGVLDCFAVATPITDNSVMYIGTCSASTVAVTQETASTGAALADADFNLVIYACDAEDET
jgi:hypothetical protein